MKLDAKLQSGTFDWAVAGLSTIFIGGVVLDIWAHNHDRVDTTFFTPWHAALYGGFGLLLTFLVFAAIRRAGRRFWREDALPPGYQLSLAGGFVFLVGGVLDMFWHMAFGLEDSVDALLSPTHLILMVGGLLMVTGPLRAAWRAYAPGSAPGWAKLGPAIVATMLAYVIVMMFTQFAHPFVNRWAAAWHRGAPVPSEIYVMDADGSHQRRLVSDPSRRYEGYVLSPDGSRAAVAVGPADGRTSEIFVGAPDLSRLRPLTHEGARAQMPAWSPDGKRIIYLLTRPNAQRLTIVDAAGGAGAVIAADSGGKSAAAWAPDGKRIAYASDATGAWRILVTSSGRDRVRTIAGTSPAWSPRGDRIVFAGNDGIEVVRVDGASQPAPLTHGADEQPQWSPDGSRVAFVRASRFRRDVYVLELATGRVADVSRNPGADNSQPRWSRDGRQIAWTVTGRPGGASDYVRQGFGIAEVLLQAVALAAVLLLVAGWRLPIGAVTVLIVAGQATVAVQEDQFALMGGALVTALVAEALVARWRPLDGARLIATCGLVPAVFTATYLTSLALFGQGIDWSAHLAAGAPVFAGLGGAALAIVASRGRDTPQ